MAEIKRNYFILLVLLCASRVLLTQLEYHLDSFHFLPPFSPRKVYVTSFQCTWLLRSMPAQHLLSEHRQKLLEISIFQILSVDFVKTFSHVLCYFGTWTMLSSHSKICQNINNKTCFFQESRITQARRHWGGGRGGNAPPIIRQTCLWRCNKRSLI